MRKPFFFFAYAKTKTQISFAVTAKLISAFVFATQIVQSLYFLKLKFQASSHLLWLYSTVCVRPGGNPEDRFSQNEAHIFLYSGECSTLALKYMNPNATKRPFRHLDVDVGKQCKRRKIMSCSFSK